MNLILASQSPRRRELMGLYHIPFTACSADIDESMDASLPPEQEVARVSLKKAQAVERGAEDIVVAADTIVVCAGKILGKPKSAAQAAEMLRLLSGRDHQVMTGLSVLRGETAATVTEVTHIYFRELSEREIARYVESGEPMDKAGAYGIQGGAALFVRRLEGDYYNVMGLPVCRLWEILKGIAPEIMEEWV
ncbi:MAG TPA: septum formation inhibitor Maf [Candidatus Faecousia intestinigallinarum]|nr:septum formation inhibitor Maf [Candidatus Faecousia intestinigallinarum]